MKNYRLAFSKWGLIAALFIMVPNVIWFLAPPTNDILIESSSTNDFLNITTRILREILIVLLIFIRRIDWKNVKKYAVISGGFLAVYYALWILYYLGIYSSWTFISMAVAPTLYFLFIGLWLKNFPVVIVSIIFGVFHVIGFL